MSQILAKQLIYTRVEESYSPTHKSGYQVYYSSPGLKQNIVDLIVKKVSEFHPHLPDIKRWQCFFLENNAKVVISQTQIIDSHPEIIDKDRRPNILIAHCLILDWEAYKMAGYEPFRIIEQFQFISSAEEMVRQYNHNESKEFEAHFELREHLASDIDSSRRENVYYLALTAFPHFVRNKNSLLLYGEEKEIYETLKVIFSYVPPSYRENLTFDTYVKGKQVLAGEFWAIGLQEWKAGYNLALNTSTKTFSNDPKRFEDLYLLWLQKNALKSLDLRTVAEIQEVSDSFNYKRAPIKERVTDLALESFYAVHQQAILSRVLDVASHVLGKNLSLPFIKFLEKNCPLYDLISVAATNLFLSSKLALCMREWFVSLELDFGKLTSDDWTTIRRISQDTKDNILTLWCAAFTGDMKLFQIAIKTLTPDEYAYALLLMARPLKPLSLFVPRYTSQFVSVLSEKLNQLSEGEFVEIINEIMNSSGHKELDRMDGFVFHLSNRELTNLEKITAKQRIPSKFKSSIEKRRYQLGQPYTMIDAILRRK